MQTKYFFRTTFFLAFVLALIPVQSQAYGVTGKQVTELTPNLTMYTLDFEFGFINADMWMPIAASKITKEDNVTSSLVLSSAPIQKEKYFVPMKSNAAFTLLVLEEHEVGKSKGSVAVDNLPITFQKKGGPKQIKVFSKEELKDFVIKKY